MELSTKKILLRLAEWLALADIGMCSYFYYRSRIDTEFASTLGEYSLGNFVVVFSFVVLGIMLTSEFSSANNLNDGKVGDDKDGLTYSEFLKLVQWAPLPLRYLPFVSIGIFVYTFWTIGSIEWSSGEPFTQRHALGFFSIHIAFMLFPYSILASASRMPGSFSDTKIPKE